jgi:acetylornithine/N-succinyldiaminopimelate aminotransferase
MKPVARSMFEQVMVPNYQPAEILPVRGAGSRLWDQAGREYIDLACGIAVTALGHCHPRLVAALTEQAQRLWHVSNVLCNEPALRLAQKLTELTFADRAFFCNSGAEANEAAFKLARRWGSSQFGPHKHEIVSFFNAFHGRTLFTVTVGGTEKYTHGFEPLPAGVVHLPFNDIAALEAQVSERTCAVVIEPIQGEGGVMPATREFLAAARALCDRHQALLIFDEVQSGMGRSGHLYAYMHYGVVPDVLTTGKGLGGGFPVAAMLATEAAASVLTPGTHGSTYGGNALACAVAGEMLDIVSDPVVLAGVSARAEQLRSGMDELANRYGLFEKTRGLGLLQGAPLVDAWKGRAREIVAAALQQGVWLLVAGPDVLRFAPSLIIPEADLALGLQRLGAACAELAGTARPLPA